MKIFYMGRQVNGRFDSFKAKVNRAFQWVKRVTILTSVFGAFFMAGAFLYSTNTTHAIMSDSYPAKIEALKADLVSRLSKCESAGHKESDGLIVFDSNKVASIGQLQFQVKTVQHYYKKLYGQTITAKEATEIALDQTKASKLASDIIFKAGGIDNWYNCATKLDLRTEVKIINRLAK